MRSMLLSVGNISLWLASILARTVALGFEYDYTNGDYMRDHDPETWTSMDVRAITQRQCLPIPKEMGLCRNVGYVNMSVPNLLGHDTVDEVKRQAAPWVPLYNIGCHPNTDLFLCALYAPVCLDRPIFPCRSLCEAVKSGCEGYMNKYGFEWPEILRCKKFPVGDNLCIKQLHFANTTGVYISMQAGFYQTTLNCTTRQHLSAFISITGI